MKQPNRPKNEAARLHNLQQFRILDTPPEVDYDCLANLAAQVCGCGTGAISFIDENRQWLKARTNPGITQAPRQITFCGHTILQDDVFVVENAQEDERFFDNPLVNDLGDIQFYAGVPIVTPEGYKVGALCVIDNRPRSITAEQKNMLTAIAQQVSRLLQLRLQNVKIQEEANALLSIESLTVKQTLRGLEDTRLTLGTELHENMAQTLAAIKLQVELAEGQPHNSPVLMQGVKKTIMNLLHDVRTYTKTLMPVALHPVSVAGMVQGLIKKYFSSLPLVIKLSCRGEEEMEHHVALAVFRVLEDSFKLVLTKEAVTQVSLQINAGAEVAIELCSDGTAKNRAATQMLVTGNTIRNRIEMMNGIFEMGTNARGMQVLRAILPIRVAATHAATA